MNNVELWNEIHDELARRTVISQSLLDEATDELHEELLESIEQKVIDINTVRFVK